MVILLAMHGRFYQLRRDRIGNNGARARIRHPQYVAFVPSYRFLSQWPTLLTLIMFPILVFVYIRLTRKEEADAKREFSEVWNSYTRQTPAFIPRSKKQLIRCGECGFYYADKEWAEKCEAWCKENRSCNLEITSHAVENLPRF